MRPSLLAALLCLAAPMALACGGPPVCTVIDPTGTPLNVRENPKGRILATLKRGSQVEVLDHAEVAGQVWALVARFDSGAETLMDGEGAWVFAAYLTCDRTLAGLPGEPWQLDYDSEVPCTVADPTATPLNLRETAAGEIWGTVRNGTKVRASAITRVKGKDWAFVSRWSSDNAVGWVFDPYLGCEEDAN